MTAALDAALAYAQGGAAVLPLHTPADGACSCRRPGCPNVGKHPRVQAGKDDASSDAGTITDWWRMWPNANVGIRPASGLFILDVDPRNGGAEQYAAMEQRHGCLPRTRTARTGSGGGHLWFSLPGDLRGQLAPGIDIKTHTGYVVAPPSRHASGDRYEWTDTGPIVPAPAWLAALVRRPEIARSTYDGQASAATVAGLVRVVRQAQEGGRNAALYWAACRAAEKGVDPAPLIEAAVQAGLTLREAERTASSAARAPGGARA